MVEPKTRRPWWRGPLIAIISVGVAAFVRNGLETFWHFYFLPMMPAVMITALLADRWSVTLAICLSVIANLLQVHGVSHNDAVINSALFALISWGIAEVCWRLIQALRQARRISHDLFMRETVLDTILTSAPIVTLDHRGHVRRITPVAAELLSVTPEAASSRPFSAFLNGFDPSLLEHLGEGGMLEPPPQQRWTTVRPDGAITSLIIHADILPDDIGPEHAVLTLADQTQANAAKDRSHALTLRLHQTWRLHSLGEMAATLAHELNQPLTAATVYLHAGQKELNQVGPEGEAAAHTLELAKAQLLRAGEIIRRTRELIYNGSRSLTQERISSLVADLIPALELISRDAQVPIHVDIQDMDDEVLVDRIQMQQAVTNLARNAIDAAAGQAQGKGRVVITGRAHPHGGYELTVADNGPGIPDDQLERIFEPMMTTKSTGMGLGLPVTRSIIENHGGQITVGRSPSGGASFSFHLPPNTEFEAA